MCSINKNGRQRKDSAQLWVILCVTERHRGVHSMYILRSYNWAKCLTCASDVCCCELMNSALHLNCFEIVGEIAMPCM